VSRDEPPPEARRAVLRIVRGEPDDAELAALTAVLAAAPAAPSAPPATPSTWNDPQTRLRRPVPAGPHAWRTAAWPR